jgi:uncharacterized membrane protein
METRPKLKAKFTSTDKVIEIAGWLTLITIWLLALWSFFVLPKMIPVHYNAAGQVDSHGNKGTIFMLPIIATILFVGMTILNKYPHIFNYPTNITPDNAFRQYTYATRMIRYLKFAIMIVFTLIVFMTLQKAAAKSEGLGIWFLPLILGIIYLPMIYFIIKLFRTKH